MATNFTTGNPSKQLFGFALPLLLTNILKQMYNIVDSAVVGRLIGKDALSAVGASYPIIFTLTTLISGVIIGFTIVIAQYFGAKKISEVKATITTLYFFIFGFSILFSFIALFFSNDIFKLLDLPSHLMQSANSYFTIYISGLILFLLYSGTSAILRGVGDSKTPLYFMIFSTFLNVLLDFVFVYFCHFGVKGVAWASVLSQGIALIGLIYYVHCKNAALRISWHSLLFNVSIFKKALRIGVPSGVQMLAVSLRMLVISKLINGFGTNVIAAHSVAMRIDSIAIMPVTAYSKALTSFTGQNVGAGFFSRVMKGYKTSLKQSLVICFFITICIFFFSENLMRIFTTNEEVIRIGQDYLTIVSSFYFLFTFLFNTTGVLKGAGDTFVPMCITIFSLWFVRVPFAYYFSNFWAEKGIWWSIPMGWAVGAFLAMLYLYSGKWKGKGIIKRNKMQARRKQKR